MQVFASAKTRMLLTASAMALFTAHGALAQDAADNSVDEVVITASRVAREGFSAPTPTTVIGQAQIEARGVTNITEVINETPAFRPSQTPAAATRGGGISGGSFLDLRGLNGTISSTSTARTLVLVDGRRHVPANAAGLVDINMIPTGLVERTEVVTGGASAAWGSDAVAGVVNIILKDRLQGFEGNIAYGVSDEGDNKEYAINLAAGTSFAGGRGHAIVGVDYVDNKGVPDGYISRDWTKEGYFTLTFPAGPRPAGLPSRVFSGDVRISDRMAPGGIIVGGPLDNIEFTGGQGTRIFTPGSIVAGSLMIGGGTANSNAIARFIDGSNLVNPIERYAVLARVTYDFTDKISGFFEYSHAESEYNGFTAQRRDDANLTIQRDNAFLPDAIRQQMTTLGLNTITVGRVSYDQGYGAYTTHTDQQTNRFVAGLKGELGGSWKWDAYYQYGRNNYVQNNQSTLNSNYAAAVDAVRDAGGNIVCRPGAALAAADPGCVPFNIFGQNSPSQAAIAYVRGVGVNDVTTKQQVAAANLNGDVFTLPAGPVSVAVGVEWRKEQADSTVDANSQASRFDLNNYKPIHGAYSTKEVYGEVAVPLLRDVVGFKTLDFNAAARRTDYSTSGPVTTWKVGGIWEPIDAVRFRVTQSRDVRAPNISELFASEVQVREILNGVQVNGIQMGNSSLRPEKADTFTAGVVVQPPWVPGLRLSVDYYDITIKGAIARLTAQNTFDRCQAGNAELCANIVRTSTGAIDRVLLKQLNFNSIETSGFDFELSYSVPQDLLVPGRFQLRALATYVGDLTTVDVAGSVNRAKQVTPQWAGNFNVNYTLNRFSANAQVRYIGAMIRDATLYGVDAAGYNPALPFTINDNTLPPMAYLNLSAQYDLITSGGRKLQIYGVMNNVLDTDPPAGGGLNLSLASLYDLVGRSFRVGVRFKY
jgi:outer membrane receptor protein involved in Fe transport